MKNSCSEIHDQNSGILGKVSFWEFLPFSMNQQYFWICKRYSKLFENLKVGEHHGYIALFEYYELHQSDNNLSSWKYPVKPRQKSTDREFRGSHIRKNVRFFQHSRYFYLGNEKMSENSRYRGYNNFWEKFGNLESLKSWSKSA